MKFQILYSSLIVMVLTACQSQKYTLENLPEHQLIIGQGGGFSGQEISYILLENGQVFKANSLTKITEGYGKLPKKKAAEFYQMLAEMNLSSSSFNHPGNTYKFIKEKSGDSVYTLTWGQTDKPVPPSYTEFYEMLKETLNTLTDEDN